jgi:hypothetical protein
MPLLRSAALQVPSIRRLVDHRDRLLAELEAERATLRMLEEQAAAARQHHTAELEAERAALRMLEEQAAAARQHHTAELEAERATLRMLEEQAAATRQHHTAELEAERATLRMLVEQAAEARQYHIAELEAERAARQTLEQDTAGLRQARDENRLFITEYAYFPASRPIEAAAGGRQVEALFRRCEPAIAATIAGIARHAEALARIPHRQDGPLRPYWQNNWFPPFDGAELYGLIAEQRPRRYVEVGSGISTRFARQAVADLGLPTQIVSIDPHPHNAVAELCDEIMVQRMEDMPAAFWSVLAADDMLFIDNSHRSFPGSDVTVFFAEVMPALPRGVIYGVHDIFLPRDYPPGWNERFYSEQYLLMAYLLGGNGGDQVLLPVHWAATQPQLHGLLSPLWERADLFHKVGPSGGAYWARRGGGIGRVPQEAPRPKAKTRTSTASRASRSGVSVPTNAP